LRKSTGYGVIAGLLLVAAEGLSYLTLRVENPSIRRRLYWPPAVTAEEFASYLQGRDHLPGWPSRDWLAEYADATGASTSREFTFKPRFRIAGKDELWLEPIPIDSDETFRRAIERPADVLMAEAYRPDGPSMHSKVFASFPYSLTLVRLARRVFTQLDFQQVSPSRRVNEWVYPSWFDSHDGPAPDKVRLNALLMRRFGNTCEVRRQRCVVLLIPSADEIERRLANRPDPVEQIVRPMAQEIEVWDSTGYFAEHSKDRGVCYYIGLDRDCRGHYNADGYALVASFVADKVLEGSTAVGEAQPFRWRSISRAAR
jgi:hypothetical protein